MRRRMVFLLVLLALFPWSGLADSDACPDWAADDSKLPPCPNNGSLSVDYPALARVFGEARHRRREKRVSSPRRARG